MYIDLLSALRNSFCVYLKYVAQSWDSDEWGKGGGGCLTASILWVSPTQHCVNNGCNRKQLLLIDDS
jgi:hypothetical protein